MEVGWSGYWKLNGIIGSVSVFLEKEKLYGILWIWLGDGSFLMGWGRVDVGLM